MYINLDGPIKFVVEVLVWFARVMLALRAAGVIIIIGTLLYLAFLAFG